MIRLSTLRWNGKKPKGSRPGGIFTDQDGVTWMVKGNPPGSEPAETEIRARNELLATLLLRKVDSGRAPELNLIDLQGSFGGGVGVMSRMLDGLQRRYLDSSQHADFAAHALLANHDVVGPRLDNLLYRASTQEWVAVDLGGALLFRASGLRKRPLTKDALEWYAMRERWFNVASWRTFAHLSVDQLQQSAYRLRVLTDEVIREQAEIAGMNGEIPGYGNLIETILRRRDYIFEAVK